MANYSSTFLPMYRNYSANFVGQQTPAKYVAPFVTFFVALYLLLRLVKNGRVSYRNPKPKKGKLVNLGLLLPFRLPVIDVLYYVYKVRRDGVHYLDKLSKRYGNLFEFPFISVNLTVVADPVIVQKILSSTDPHHLNRPNLHRSIFEDSFHDGLLTSEYEKWTIQRKMLTHCFTYKSLQNYLVFMNTHSQKLANSLLLECKENGTVEGKRIDQLLYCYAFKTISQIVMRTDCLSSEESELVSTNANRCKDLLVERLMNPFSYKNYFWLHPQKREYDYLNKFLNNFIVDMKDMYKRQAQESNKMSWDQNNCDRNDFVDDQSMGVIPFRSMIEEMICSGAEDKEICDQVGTFLGTGHETTVVAIRMLLLHLALNPDHQTKCREEVDLFYSQHPNDEVYLTMDDFHNLKYLERCVFESGRLTATVPLYLRRLDSSLKIDDNLEFPTNTIFAICPWILHRDPAIFPNPLKFDPDRFFAENVKERHLYSYIPFSMGPKRCIGYKVALMQIKITMTQILRKFEISSDEKLENVKLLLGLTIVPKNNFQITLKRRVNKR